VIDDKLYLSHIRECIARIRRATEGGRDGFLSSEVIQDAVIRNCEVIGEAAKRISNETCLLEPGIPWRQITAFRNVLIHQYMGIDIEAVWKVVADDLSALDAAAERLLSKIE
jgi:uncharacterized protein with HEPN domain